jgi:hypothetical protein
MKQNYHCHIVTGLILFSLIVETARVPGMCVRSGPVLGAGSPPGMHRCLRVADTSSSSILSVVLCGLLFEIVFLRGLGCVLVAFYSQHAD